VLASTHLRIVANIQSTVACLLRFACRLHTC